MSRILLWGRRGAAAVAMVVVVANVWHRLIAPQAPPDPATYPEVGDIFESRVEGFRQQVVAVREGGLVLRTRIAPRAPGPPKHAHRSFTEVFKVESGTLRIDLQSGPIDVGPGEELRIPPGTPHRPHNVTDAEVVVATDEVAMPQAFGACLVQMYHFLDRAEGRVGPRLMFRIAALDGICDAKMTDVPAPVQAFLEWGVVPFARLAGYRNYYPELSLHPPGDSRVAAR